MLHETVIGALWSLASAVTYAVANILVRHLSTSLPPLEMAMFRAAGGLVMVLVAWRAFLHLRDLRDPAIHGVRAVVGAVSIMTLVYSYATLPIALVTAVMYLRVLLVIPLGWIFLAERPTRAAWIAAGIGIAGALVALWPRLVTVGTPAFTWGVLALPIAALAGAGSQICMRRLAHTNPASVVVAVSSIIVPLMIAVPASSVAVAPPSADLPLLVGMALISGLAQWATVRGYTYAAPAQLMPVTMVDIPIALVVGYALWSELPTLHGAVGSAVVVAAALYVTRSKAVESR